MYNVTIIFSHFVKTKYNFHKFTFSCWDHSNRNVFFSLQCYWIGSVVSSIFSDFSSSKKFKPDVSLALKNMCFFPDQWQLCLNILECPRQDLCLLILTFWDIAVLSLNWNVPPGLSLSSIVTCEVLYEQNSGCKWKQYICTISLFIVRLDTIQLIRTI